MFKWLKNRKKKLPKGLKEKNEMTELKIKTAMKILDQRKEQMPIDFERRIRDYSYGS